MLTRLTIKNYRSLENVDIPLESLTAFVGPNGSGKTSILQALNVVLGEFWPSLRSFRIPQDFIGFDSAREIEISVWFNPPYIHEDTLGKTYEVHGLRVSCRPYRKSGKWGEAGDLHVDIEPIDEKGNVPNVAISQPRRGEKPQFRPLTVGSDLRDYARTLFIDHRRALSQHLPTTRGSILARLLLDAKKEFSPEQGFKQAYEEAMDYLRTPRVREIEKMVAETAKRMLGFLGSAAAKSVTIGFGFADPANPFNSLRLEYHEPDLTVPGDELGLGIQSAIVVGVFDAFRQLGGKVGAVVIEEPEMYLHPQAQRYFHRLLCKLVDSDQCQVIYSTHSPIFADVNRFEELRLVRRELGQFTRVHFVGQRERVNLNQARKALKLGGRFDPARNEVLFAKRALLVEGYGDKSAALIVADKLHLDVDAEGVAIIDCGGKAGIELVARVCGALGIPFAVLHDEDIWPVEGVDDPAKVQQENEEAEAANRRIREAVVGENTIFVLRPSLEAALGIGRKARDKPRKVVEALHKMDVEDIPEPLIKAVRSLLPESRGGGEVHEQNKLDRVL